tara:strand:- start:8802 stop:9206 length:405 start_codon:yes stop_codon:yes gene_type:complete
MFASASIYLLVFIGIIYIDTIPMSVMYGLMFCAGFFFSGQNLVFAMATENMPLGISGIATAFTNMIVMLSGVIFEPLVGWLLDYKWDGTLRNGVPYFTIDNFTFALTSVPIALGFAVLSLLFIKETYPSRAKPN